MYSIHRLKKGLQNKIRYEYISIDIDTLMFKYLYTTLTIQINRHTCIFLYMYLDDVSLT